MFVHATNMHSKQQYLC